MGLDVYVGALTRYYAHDWETVVQRAGREQGIPVEIQRWNEPADAIQDPALIREMVLAWRSGISQSLRRAGLIEADLEWREGAETPYFTDKPAWDCYGAIQLLAAYEENEKPIFGSPFPKKLRSDWQQDSVLTSLQQAKFAPRYAHLYGCELWLPANLKTPFHGPAPTGNSTRIGSVDALLSELETLNERTYKGGHDQLVRWRNEMPEGEDDRFEPKAKTGLAIMLELTAAARRERLPIILDY